MMMMKRPKYLRLTSNELLSEFCLKIKFWERSDRADFLQFGDYYIFFFARSARKTITHLLVSCP